MKTEEIISLNMYTFSFTLNNVLHSAMRLAHADRSDSDIGFSS